jgi:lambda family phage minor tail protein L
MAKGVSQVLNKGLLELEPTAVLEFFIIYYNYEENPAEFISVHAGSNGIGGNIKWQGIDYRPFNIEGSAWELSNDQRLPRPKLTVSNKGQIVSTLLRKYKNLNGCKVIRKRTLARFLDDENFPNNNNPYGAENTNAGFPDEKYYISHVISENKESVEFELITPLEMENQKIPNRKVHSVRCGFVYRGYGCRYSGPPVADQTNTVFAEIDSSDNTITELKLTADNDLQDESRYNRGNWNQQRNQGGTNDFSNGTGLYAVSNLATNYPIITGVDSPPHTNSCVSFNGNGVICLSTGDRSPLQAPNQLMHPSGRGHLSRTISFWCKPLSGASSNPKGVQVIYDQGTYNEGGLAIFTRGSGEAYTGLQVVIRTSGSSQDKHPTGWVEMSGGGADIWNEWNHIAVTYTMDRESGSGNNTYLYINGRVVDSGNCDDVPYANRIGLWSTGQAGIGAQLDNSAICNEYGTFSLNSFITSGFSGYFDDLRQYDRHLNAQQIYNLYQGNDVSLLTFPENKGEWSSTGTYNRGDSIYIEGHRYKMFSDRTRDGFRGIQFWFLCLTDNTTTDPREDSTNWMRDACAKDVPACSLRYGDVLPFGGFPGTHRYPFSARQNGY